MELHIIQNQKLVKNIPLLLGQTLTLKAEADTIYRLVDENGQLIAEPKSASENKDLLLFLENSDVPNVVLEDYFTYSIIEDFQTLQQLNATFATVSHAPETLIASQGQGFSPALVGVGVLGLAGIGVALANSGDDEKSDTASQPNNTNNNPPNNSINPPIDKTAPVLNITIDNIPNITTEYLDKSITLSGQLSTNEVLQNQKVKVLINGIEKTAIIKDKTWELKVLGKELAKNQGNQNIQVEYTASDLAGNSAMAKSASEYLVDTIPTIQINPITEDNIINLSESQNAIEISGTVKNFKIGERLNIKIGQANPIIVTIKNDGSFSFLADGQTLANHNTVEVNLIPNQIFDTSRSASGKQSYEVDLTPPNPEITLNPITGDNKINLKESENPNTEISGSVSGIEENSTVLVVCSCSTCTGTRYKEIPVVLNPDKTFKVSLETDELLKYDTITAKVQTEDKAKNKGEAENSQKYELDNNVPATPIGIKLNPIFEDNIIQHSEKNNPKTIISGEYEILNLKADESAQIQLLINGQTYQTKTQAGEKTFSIEVNTADLLADNQIHVTVSNVQNSAGNINSGSASTVHRYFVEGNQEIQPQIYLNPVELGLAEEIGSVRLSGKIDFENSDSMYKWGHNKDFVKEINLKIGDKEFMVGINNDYLFYLDLTYEQYQELKGQKISYTLKASNEHYFDWLPSFDYKSNSKEQWVSVPANWTDVAKEELKKVKISFDDLNIQNSRNLDFNINYQSKITGTVLNTQIGDEVEININGKIYQTTVKDNYQFEITVSKEELKNTSKIQAVLKTKNQQGENTSVSDIENVEKALIISDEFVNPHEIIPLEERVIQHSNPNYNFPYFIHVNTPYGWHYGGFLNRFKSVKGSGEPAIITYYFATNKDYANGLKPYSLKNMIEYNAEQQQGIREAYELFEAVTPIKFVEVFNKDEADSVFVMGEHSGEWKGIDGKPFPFAGYASYGHGVTIVSGGDKDFVKSVGIHEILHTFGTDHIWDTLHKLDYGKHEAIGELSSMATGEKRWILRPYDLAYLHYRFGVNPNYKTGNDVYHFRTFNPETSDGGVYIWDGAGVDTFDASKEKEKVYLNLTPGSWIYRGEISDTFVVKDKIKINDFNEVNKFFPEFPDTKFIGNVNFKHEQIIYAEGQAFIGYGTQIENAIGSSYDDTIKGNKADNNLFGEAGNDEIHGDAGNDYINGGKGEDKMHGGLGDDIYIIDNSADVVIENANEGADMVYSAVNYTLTVNVENLQLKGQALSGTGNELDNLITGNDHNNELYGLDGHDELNGGRGSDTLTGGNGNDKFVFNGQLDGSIDTIADFNINEDKIVLDKKIFVGIDTQIGNLFQTYLNYDGHSGLLSFDPDANGSADPIYFAKLNPNLNLGENNIEII